MKVRLFVAVVMLLLGFAGLVVTQVSKEGAWNYWKYVSVLFAFLSIGLTLHLRKEGLKTTLVHIWHEVAHWVGLIAAIFITSYLIQMGLIGRFEASLMMLLMLALATYLAGIYGEPSFILVGIALGCFATGIAFIGEFLYTAILPATLLFGTLIFYIIHKTHQKR